MIFLAFCGLSFCGCKTSLSGGVFIIVALSKSVHNCCVPHQAQASVPKAQSHAIWPPFSLVRPTGSKVEARPMQVNDLLRMELIAECLGKWPAFLVQKRPWSPSSSTILPQRHFVLSKILAPVRRAIAIRSSSGLSNFPTLAIGNVSDQAAV